LRLIGIWDPKIGKSGKQLPNVRVIRNVIVTDENFPAADMTHILMQWGQFIDHDMIHVPSFRTGNHEYVKLEIFISLLNLKIFSKSIKH
jgi:peroxidase